MTYSLKAANYHAFDICTCTLSIFPFQFSLLLSFCSFESLPYQSFEEQYIATNPTYDGRGQTSD